jgi:hypothetical protein
MDEWTLPGRGPRCIPITWAVLHNGLGARLQPNRLQIVHCSQPMDNDHIMALLTTVGTGYRQLSLHWRVTDGDSIDADQVVAAFASHTKLIRLSVELSHAASTRTFLKCPQTLPLLEHLALSSQDTSSDSHLRITMGHLPSLKHLSITNVECFASNAWNSPCLQSLTWIAQYGKRRCHTSMARILAACSNVTGDGAPSSLHTLTINEPASADTAVMKQWSRPQKDSIRTLKLDEGVDIDHSSSILASHSSQSKDSDNNSTQFIPFISQLPSTTHLVVPPCITREKMLQLPSALPHLEQLSGLTSNMMHYWTIEHVLPLMPDLRTINGTCLSLYNRTETIHVPYTMKNLHASPII